MLIPHKGVSRKKNSECVNDDGIGRNPREQSKSSNYLLRARKGETSVEKILDKILSNVNLNLAYQRVYQNRGIGGVDEMDVFALKGYLRENGEEIKELIHKRKFKPQPVMRVEIPKDNGGVRLLGIPTVVDRVIQQAIHQVLSPIVEEQFHENSYGFRPNRNGEQAIVKSLELLNEGYEWVVDNDLERFFDTVHHDKLMRLISNTIADGDVISLIRKYLVSGVMSDGKYAATPEGTPQGGPLSPLLRNIMLNELDKELKARGLNFVRYADDALIFTKSAKAAERVMNSVSCFIIDKLGILVNVQKSRVSRPMKLKFLGFGFYKDVSSQKWQSRPHPESVRKFQRKIKKLTKRNWSRSLDMRIKKLNQLIKGWVNYYKIAKIKSALTRIDEKLRFRIRMIIWKQWKVPKKQIASLVKLGIPIEEAKGLTWCRKGYNYIAHSKVVHRALSNNRLKQRGIPSALEHYLTVHTVI